MLYNELKTHGGWLFRHRSYLPLILVAISPLALIHGEYFEHFGVVEDIYTVFCYVVALYGFSIRIKTVGHTPRGTSGRNTHGQKADSLNTTGIYSVVRHPLYYGNFFMWLGIVLATQQIWFIALFVALYALYYERIMLAEEGYLRSKFGDEFVQWADRTPVFFPRWSQWAPSSLPFSWKSVLRREYSGLLAMTICFAFVDVVGDFFEEGAIELLDETVVIMLASLVLVIVLRFLKKTHRLDVEGR